MCEYMFSEDLSRNGVVSEAKVAPEPATSVCASKLTDMKAKRSTGVKDRSCLARFCRLCHTISLTSYRMAAYLTKVVRFILAIAGKVQVVSSKVVEDGFVLIEI